MAIRIVQYPFWERDLFTKPQQYNVVKKVDGYRIFDMWHGYTHAIKVFPSGKAVKTTSNRMTRHRVKTYYNCEGKEIISDKHTELARNREEAKYWRSLE